MEEENEIEEQSGQPIQHQIPQSQQGKAKTVLLENNLSTVSFPFRFFIQLSSQRRTCHVILPWFTGSYIGRFSNIRNSVVITRRFESKKL